MLTKNDNYPMLTGKKNNARCHSITIRLVLQNQPFPPVFQDMAPTTCTRQKQAPCPLQEEWGWAAQASRKCHPARTQRRRWYLAAGSVNHVPGKTYLAIPGPDSSTESPGEHRCCVHRRGGASPSFPKTMGLGGTFVSCTGLQRTAGPEPRRSQPHE